MIDTLEPCWKDRTCLAVMAAGLSAAVSAGRRWDVIGRVKRTNTVDKIRYIAAGAIVSGVVSAVLTVMGCRRFPEHQEYVVGGVVIAALVFDWGSDSGIELLRRIVKWVAKKVLPGEIFEDKESSPATTGSQKTDLPTKDGT